MDRCEVAWAAGFFDGEGWVGQTKDGYVSVHIGQIHPEVLQRFKTAVGERGHVTGPYAAGPNDRPNTKPKWNYHSLARAAEEVMELLYPHLGSVKRDQFNAACVGARTPARPGWCRADLHEMADRNISPDGRCRACRNARVLRDYHANKGRVAP